MSCGATPGYNLFTEGGRSNLRTAFRYKSFSKPPLGKVLRHTLAPIWCRIVGHDKYDAGIPPEGNVYDLACHRCQHFITPPGSA